MTIDVQQVKDRHRLSAVIGRRVKLRKAGHELVGLCPFHSETTPSFRVNDAKGVYHCFGCGAAGDMLDYLREAEGLDFRAAIESLASGNLPETDPIDRAAEARRETADREATRKEALRQWLTARPLKGTPAEIYLRSRGIVGQMPWSVRYGVVPITIDRETGRGGRRLPALILACQNGAGRIMGVQRVFLTEDGTKAAMANPKLSLGPTRGCTIRLGPTASRAILCEGPEDGLTLRQRFPDGSVWVTLGTAGLALAELPAQVSQVTLAGDNNAPGRAAVAKASRAYGEQGRAVSAMFPAEPFEDWNDELTGQAVSA